MRLPLLLTMIAACGLNGSLTIVAAEPKLAKRQTPEVQREVTDAVDGMEPVMVSLKDRESPSEENGSRCTKNLSGLACSAASAT